VSHDYCPYDGHKNLEKEGEVLISFFRD
jgi:hypothetical protein